MGLYLLISDLILFINTFSAIDEQFFALHIMYIKKNHITRVKMHFRKLQNN